LPESQKRFCTEAHEDHEEVPREESLKLLPEILDGVTRIFPTIALLLLSFVLMLVVVLDKAVKPYSVLNGGNEREKTGGLRNRRN
jgi:hypothetical protein